MTNRPMRLLLLPVTLCMAFLLQACTRSPGTAQAPHVTPFPVQVRTSQTALSSPASCTGQFITHALDFATGIRMREIRTYDSNGAGVAMGDLNGDGLLDIVFASIDRESTIFWNEGNFKFREEPLEDRNTRGVALVDVNGDGLLDIAYTHRGIESVSLWQNQGPSAEPRFVREPLEGVANYAYSMAWADVNKDGTLDLVTGAYDVDLKGHGIAENEIKAKGGVVLYEQHAGKFIPRQLTQQAETLSIGLLDLDGDGEIDIWAANDFAMPDAVWLNHSGEWQSSQLFKQTSYSSMSIDWGDLDNNRQTELFTTDMNPGDISAKTLAIWLPVMSKLEEKHGPNDPQIMANVLQAPSAADGWNNEAARRGIDATGWSWSGKFGDLNNDGYLDLYIVNGMIATNLFGHQPLGELVEENQAYRNTGRGSFQPAPEWGLGSKSSGRGMVMGDLNNDGRLDIVVNNLRSQAQLFENRLCAGSSLEVDLAWPNSGNSHAIGAKVELRTNHGTYQRDVRASGGYLSGDPQRIHFGFPEDTQLKQLLITYPDGAAATINQLKAQTLITVSR